MSKKKSTEKPENMSQIKWKHNILNVQEAAKAVLEEKLIVINTYIKKKKQGERKQYGRGIGD